MEDFKERLQRLRRGRGYTQYTLADAIGVSVDSVRRWEYGRREPRMSELVHLSRVLGVSMEELAGVERQGVITLQHGGMKMELPATAEGLAMVKRRLEELTAGEGSQRGSSDAV